MSEQNIELCKIKALFEARQRLIAEKVHEANSLKELEKSAAYIEWKAAQERRVQVAAEEQKLYADVVDLAISAFSTDKTNFKPFPGVQIKAFTIFRVALEPDQIINALIEHRAIRALQPAKGWEKVAVAIGIDGVTEDKEYRAQVASDLGPAIAIGHTIQ